eukprot:6081014-Amphidinium_carterae.1
MDGCVAWAWLAVLSERPHSVAATLVAVAMACCVACIVYANHMLLHFSVAVDGSSAHPPLDLDTSLNCPFLGHSSSLAEESTLVVNETHGQWKRAGLANSSHLLERDNNGCPLPLGPHESDELHERPRLGAPWRVR